MGLHERIKKLEAQARRLKPDTGKVERVLPWPDGAPLRVMVVPEVIELLKKCYEHHPPFNQPENPPPESAT